jgi:hypothetical protein
MKAFPLLLIILVLVASCASVDEEIGSRKRGYAIKQGSIASPFEGMSPYEYAEKQLGKRPSLIPVYSFLGFPLNYDSASRSQQAVGAWDQAAQALIRQRLLRLGEQSDTPTENAPWEKLPPAPWETRTPTEIVPPKANQGQSDVHLRRGFNGSYTPNAYGPGMNADATGRPFIWQPMTPGPKSFDPFLQVQPNAYGPGVGMDQYGRPVRPSCPPGWAGPC